jgi:hypothetical protein
MAEPKKTQATAGNGSDSEVEHFTVDTGLFRELGELLVGRDSTALVELIKNAYDADATAVTVVAQDLADPHKGIILVSDDGNGMTIEEFRRDFLRVASRLKAGGDRRSPVYKRRFTGAKGIGRLAAHKLASDLTIESRALTAAVRHGRPERAAAGGLRGRSTGTRSNATKRSMTWVMQSPLSAVSSRTTTCRERPSASAHCVGRGAIVSGRDLSERSPRSSRVRRCAHRSRLNT